MGKWTALPCTKMKWLMVIVVALCLVSWGSSRIFARDARSCDDDVAKFCKDVQPGGGGIIKCLKDHENDVSSGCREDLSRMKGPAFFEACRDDLQKLCKDIKPGEGRIIQCLKSHENELSPQCKAGLPGPPPNDSNRQRRNP